MAIYLSRKKGGVTPTSITPSNSNPATLTANSAVTPTANGYAIASYDTIFPPAVSPEQIEYGKIYQALDDGYAIGYLPIEVYPSNEFPDILQVDRYYQAKGNGYVIESYDYIIPSSTPRSISQGDMVQVSGSAVIVDSITNKTPDDTTPPTVASGDIVKMGGAGYLYATQQSSPTSITPSNSSPVALTANTPVKPTASGYAISSYSSKTPSDSSPASVSSGAIIKASASGYLYASSGLKKFKSGTFSMPSTGNTVTVTCGFKPKYIAYFRVASSGTATIYDEDYSTTSTARCTSSGISSGTIGSQNYGLNSITNTGFIVNGGSSTGTYYYFAVG